GGPLAIPLAVAGVVGPLAINFGLYLLAFQLLTNIHVAWRPLLPGSALGAVGWTVLQDLGTFVIQHEASHTAYAYGSFAVVIALLAWIYLGGRLTLYAAEVNVVWGYGLWPRSLTGPPRTAADLRALERLTAEANRLRSSPPVEIGATPPAGP
ncbi:MAG: YihY/virulence factor BrkB family protein, partial [Acidimicrobiales bacterium]